MVEANRGIQTHQRSLLYPSTSLPKRQPYPDSSKICYIRLELRFIPRV